MIGYGVCPMKGFVIRETESYPTYYLGHKKYFETLKNYVSQFENLQLIGRGGMYKYDNMDHAIYSGILAARNYIAGNKKYDIWQINEDAEYLEK
jgi:UDP-galactopyranose mutase